MKFHPAGRGTILFAVILFVTLVAVAHFITCVYGSVSVSLIGFIILILTLQFFRYPQREVTLNEQAVICPADGRVCVIEEAFEPMHLKQQCLKVSIFMSPFNVHINWIPVSGVITFSKHIEGKFLAAFKDKSAEENERYITAIKMENGIEIVANQVAGAMARRILNFKQEGNAVKQDDELGFIRFGSRVDLYLPLNTKLNVKLGDKVVGSQTIIGEFENER
ncbi:MAG: phosphatidylserine decarboxylase family protein [Mangrovibacterium sp.]